MRGETRRVRAQVTVRVPPPGSAAEVRRPLFSQLTRYCRSTLTRYRGCTRIIAQEAEREETLTERDRANGTGHARHAKAAAAANAGGGGRNSRRKRSSSRKRRANTKKNIEEDEEEEDVEEAEEEEEVRIDCIENNNGGKSPVLHRLPPCAV